MAGLIGPAIRPLPTPLDQAKAHPDSPDHGTKSEKFGKRGNHVTSFLGVGALSGMSKAEAGEMRAFNGVRHHLVNKAGDGVTARGL